MKDLILKNISSNQILTNINFENLKFFYDDLLSIKNSDLNQFLVEHKQIICGRICKNFSFISNFFDYSILHKNSYVFNRFFNVLNFALKNDAQIWDDEYPVCVFVCKKETDLEEISVLANFLVDYAYSLKKENKYDNFLNYFVNKINFYHNQKIKTILLKKGSTTFIKNSTNPIKTFNEIKELIDFSKYEDNFNQELNNLEADILIRQNKTKHLKKQNIL